MQISEISSVWPLYSCYRTLLKRIERLRFAKAHKDYWTKTVSQDIVDQEISRIEEMVARLGENSLTEQVMKSARKLEPVERWLDENVGFSFDVGNRSLSYTEKNILENLKNMSDKQRKNERGALIKLELEDKLRRNWFVVFNTLTVSPGNEMKVFGPGANAWRVYARDVSRSIKKVVYGDADFKQERSEYHTYCAVVERGTKGTQRLHIHVLHCMAALPEHAKDPNVGARYAYRKELECMKRFWKYGNSSPLIVRFGNGDAYGLAGYRWPVKKKGRDYVREKGSPIGAVATYMAKYMSKQGSASKNWRTRMTKGYGRKWMRIIAQAMSQRQLEMMVSMRSYQKWTKNSLIQWPQQYLRLIMIDEWLRRMKKIKTQEDLLKLTCVTEQPIGLLQQLRSQQKEEMKGQKIHTIQRSTIILGQETLTDSDICDVREIFKSVEAEIEASGTRSGRA